MTRSKWLAVGGTTSISWDGLGLALVWFFLVWLFLINICHNTDDQWSGKEADGLLTKSKKTRRMAVGHVGIGSWEGEERWTREGTKSTQAGFSLGMHFHVDDGGNPIVV